MNKEIRIGKKVIGEGQSTFIIAELSCNHRQDYDIAIDTIDAIAESGADCVKLQTAKPDSLTIDSNKEPFVIKGGTKWDNRTLYELYQETYTPWEWHEPIKDYVRDKGMEFMSSPFDYEAVDFLGGLYVPAYKIASFEITDIPLIEYTASQDKPMIISTGIANLSDIEEAVNACRRQGNDQIILLKCTSAYPTPLDEVDLKTIPNLKETFGTEVGLSDHTLGCTVPIAAVALGARVIEKHFILDKSLGGPDAEFSMNPEEFSTMVKSVRETEKALGSINYSLSDKDQAKRQFSRSLFIVEDMQQGEKFTKDNVRSIRPGHGIAPKYLEYVFSKKVKTNVEKGTPLTWDLIA